MLYLGTVLGQVMYLGYLLASLDDVGQGLLPVGLLFLLLFSMISYCSAAGTAFIIRQCLDRR